MTSPGLEVIPVGGLGPGVRAYVTTRRGGASGGVWAGANLGTRVRDDPAAVASNRAAVARMLGAPVVWAHQVHATTVAVLPGREPPAGEPVADALLATAPGLAVAAQAADCVPVLLAGFGPTGRVHAVAAVHAGRAGVVAGVVPSALQRLRDLGSTEIRAVIGPAICGRCYEVPLAMQQQVAAVVPCAVATTAWGTPSLDLPAAVGHQLRHHGAQVIPAGVDQCTRETDWLFSHRRDGVSGRHAAVIAFESGRDTPG